MRARRSDRQAFKPASQPPASAESCGPEKKTSSGAGGSERFITPLGEIRAWRAFHSLEKTGHMARIIKATAARSVRPEKSLRPERKDASWAPAFASTAATLIQYMIVLVK